MTWEPRCHITAERNWLNDPNGPIHWRGRYHLFFQENPEAPFWGSPHWGHVSSADLVTWRRHERALSPGPTGPDRDGCWSGCTRIVDGRPTLYYTGVVGDGAHRVESVCRAFGSPDLSVWTKDPRNPLVAGAPARSPTGYHRDPFLWQDERGWHLIVGSGTGGDDRHGTVLVYHSPDAAEWSFGGTLYEAPPPAAPDRREHWECPQLLRFPDAWVLVVSVQDPRAERPLRHAVYLVGDLDRYRFRGRSTGRLDFGDVFYAPATCLDQSGRVLVWGWAQEALGPRDQHRLSRAGALSLPRQLTLVDDKLVSTPVPELAGLRRRQLAGPVDLGPDGPGAQGRRVAASAPAQFEISARVAGSTGNARLRLRAPSGQTEIEIVVDLDRRRCEVRTRRHRDTQVHGAATLTGPDGVLHVFRDGSLLEVLYGGVAATTRCYDREGQPWTVDAAVAGRDAGLRGLCVWELRESIFVDGRPR